MFDNGGMLKLGIECLEKNSYNIFIREYRSNRNKIYQYNHNTKCQWIFNKSVKDNLYILYKTR